MSNSTECNNELVLIGQSKDVRDFIVKITSFEGQVNFEGIVSKDTRIGKIADYKLGSKSHLSILFTTPTQPSQEWVEKLSELANPVVGLDIFYSPQPFSNVSPTNGDVLLMTSIDGKGTNVICNVVSPIDEDYKNITAQNGEKIDIDLDI